jgi:hypothetical protein
MRRVARGLLLVTAVASIVAMGCDADAQMERFSGDWQRLQGDVADSDSALYIRGDGTSARVTFESNAIRMRSKTDAVLQGGVLRCALPTGAGEGPDRASPEPSPSAAPTAVPVRLSLNEAGDVLSVDMVAPGEQLIPLWKYTRRGRAN